MYSVLVVENNVFFRKSFREILQMHLPTVTIDEAATSEEAWQKIEASPPDIIFMDIQLSGKNGLELTREIKRHCPQVIVAIFTNYDLPEYREAAHQYGADHFLIKDSLSGAEIATLVRGILSDRSSLFHIIAMGHPCGAAGSCA